MEFGRVNDGTDLFRFELLCCALPALLRDLPCRLRYEGRKGKPIVIFVFFQISIGDEKKSIEQRRIASC